MNMSNSLKVSLQATIYGLDDRGWSRRRIRTRALDRSRDRGRYLRLTKPAISTAGNGVWRKSQCEPLAEVTKAKAELGLSARRIYQDFVGKNGFIDFYQSVKRFVCKLRKAQPEQVAFGMPTGRRAPVGFRLGAPIDDSQGKRRRIYVTW
jgi:hypothetical protein